VDGENYANPPREGGHHEPGAWRIELSPKESTTTDRFLNVMHVMDAVGGPEPLAVARIETEHVVGAKIADRVVLFSKSGEKLHETITFTVPDSQSELRYLVTDLEASNWQVIGPLNFSLEAAEEGGTVYFRGPPGTYTLRFDG
jgi:hypothetical protein